MCLLFPGLQGLHSVYNMTGKSMEQVHVGENIADMDPNASDHGLLIAIYGTLNQLMGKMEGHVKQIATVEDRQITFENQCAIAREEHRKRIDELEHRVDQWSGMAKAFALIFAPGTVFAVVSQVWKMLTTH